MDTRKLLRTYFVTLALLLVSLCSAQVTMGQLQSTTPDFLHETIGTKLRRHFLLAGMQSPSKTTVLMAPAWQPSTAYVQGQVVVNGGNRYVCASQGTSASSGGPTGGMAGGVVTDNSIYWEYIGANAVTSDPNTSLTVWSTSLSVTAGQVIVVGGLNQGNKEYGVVAAGTTASSGTGPTGTSNSVTDGTATLTYMGLYQQNPYIGTAPTLSVSTTQPGSLQWWSCSAPKSATSASSIMGITAQGSSYAAGDTITLSTGTGTAAVVKVDTVDGSGHILTAHLQSGGSYTLLPYTNPTPQASTSGSGSGATFRLAYPDAPWYHVNNGYMSGANGSNNNTGVLSVYSPALGTSTKDRHVSFQFQVDSPTVVFGYYSGGASNTQIWYDDGDGKWIRYNQTNLPYTSGQWNYATLAFPGTKLRKIRWVAGWDNVAAYFPYIGLPSNGIPQSFFDKDTVNCALISDSIVDGNPVSPFTPGFNFPEMLGASLGWNVWDFSQGGTGWCNPGSGSSNTFGYRMAQVVASKPQVVMFFGSTNDITYNQSQMTAAVASTLNSLRSLGYMGPIIVCGLEPASANALTQEGYLANAVAAWSDPANLGNTFFVPVSNTALPPIIGTYNNNPTPGGLSLSGTNNFSTYINGSDNVHPTEPAVKLLVEFIVNAVVQGVYPNMK